eukprot:TRINITY_DN46084_c0_g1_i1.p1 TRINITY_DN46084_c0_g1~~TRINITY_DN46084_c0_g1_i1.p1  ORF type:complete len:207 (+),score=18.66 TRINITY_DN46084_c0_g1_i1:92-712(+)
MVSVYFYVPNIIGWLRIILGIASFFYARTDPLIFTAMYLTSFLLDAMDGWAARVLNQCSKLGAVLDMITDRFGTMGLVMILADMYPQWLVWGILCNSLDLVSHYARMYATLSVGVESHKYMDQKKEFKLLWLYYNKRWLLGGACLINEFFYFFMYARVHFPSDIMEYCTYVCAVGWAFKQLLNTLQLISSFETIAEMDNRNAKKKK